ncbi:hypothetical protein T03_14522 [Trichinella britovi]|uniref:Uncharacterized protein n=1 Tax=Trichinella britovi TaxID=45882 RepID=A0A0V1DGG1_TRIBR|nr:hypothetical protein T03_14522 [Trichinella britovi]
MQMYIQKSTIVVVPEYDTILHSENAQHEFHYEPIYPSLLNSVSCATSYGAPSMRIAIIYLPHHRLNLTLFIKDEFQKLIKPQVVLSCSFVHAAVPTFQMVVVNEGQFAVEVCV